MKHNVLLFFVSLILASSTPISCAHVEDEWDALDAPTKEFYKDQVDGLSAPELASQSMRKEASQAQAIKPKSIKDYVFPYAMVLFLGSSLLFALVGARHNAKITVAFEDSFCKEPEGILWKQFTRLGKGQGKLLVNDSPAVFKLHANGHRHLEGAVITMTLLRRHEMMSYLLQIATRQEDAVCVELYVKESSMPQMVFAIGTAANYKELLRNNEDVKELCTRLEVKEDRIKDWPQDLFVFAEHPSYFYDMMTKPMMAQVKDTDTMDQRVFGRARGMKPIGVLARKRQVFGLVAFEKQREYFRGLQISSVSNSSHHQIIRFWFKIPKANEMDKLSTLMTAVFAMVNQIGSYSVPSERLKQSEQAYASFAKKQEPSGSFAKEVAENKKIRKRR